MSTCNPCKEQANKGHRGTPHKHLSEVDERRLFRGVPPRGYEEQDFQCLVCRAKFTWSSNRNDKPWTLWQG